MLLMSGNMSINYGEASVSNAIACLEMSNDLFEMFFVMNF